MFRFFRRGGGVRLSVLLATGALGLAGAAQAQASPPESVPAGEHSVRPSAGAGRLQEIKVELAWLGDSSTFSYPLRARAHPNGLEVRGQVPTEAVRQQALKLARQATALAVIDALVIQPTLPATSPLRTGEELLPRVRWVLAEVLGERAATIEVGTRLGGHIILRGSVASWEDKHTISTRLRGVRGCGCVINLLDVGNPPPTPPVPPVAPAARVAPPPPKAAPTWKPSPAPPKKKPAPPVMPHAPATPGALPPLPLALPDVPPARPAVTPPVMPRIMPPAVRAPGSPYGGSPTHLVVSATEEAGPFLGSSPPTKVIAVADPHQAPAQPIATGVQAPVSPYGAILPAPGPLAGSVREAPPEKKEKARQFAGSVQEKPEKLKVGTPTRDWPTAMPQRRAAPVPQPARQSMATRVAGWFTGKPKPEPRMEEAAAPPKKHNGWLAGSRPKLLSWNVQSKATTLRSEAAPRRRPVVPEKPYVTHGAIVLHDAQATPATITRTGGSSSVERLRQRVLKACAGQARNVRVERRPDRSLQVTVTVVRPEMEQNLLGSLLQLPEMTSPNVHLLIEAPPDLPR